MDFEPIRRLGRAVRRERRSLLLEPEGLELLARLGVAVPSFIHLPEGQLPTQQELTALPGQRVVLKVVSPEIAHKAAVGGVRVLPKDPAALLEGMEACRRAVGTAHITGFTVHEEIVHSPAVGAELLLGARWSREFGPIVVCGVGGAGAESVGSVAAPAISAPSLASPGEWISELRAGAAGRLIAASHPWDDDAPWAALGHLIESFEAVARELLPDPLLELEVNPLVFHAGAWVALDVLARVAVEPPDLPRPARPLHKIARLLEPESIAVVGVSEASNPGRVILQNTLASGFDPGRLYVVKRGVSSVEGCRAVPELAALPERVDLLVVALGADASVSVVEEAVAHRAAESLILISGGLGELAGSEGLAERLANAVESGRKSGGDGPVLNGANCLGIRSLPGAYDSLFLPRYKLAPPPRNGGSGVAFVSQSGALLAAKLSRLPGVPFRYCISVGNQSDLTIADYLAYLEHDPEVSLFAIYAEGLRALDGLRLLHSAAAVRRRGGRVVLYRGGRGSEGVLAAVGHTTAVAGDYEVARSLARRAGVVVAEHLDEFEDLIQILALSPPPRGRRVAVVTNAGFEAVAAADGLGGLELASLGFLTRRRLGSLLRGAGLGGVARVSNPLDLTPMAADTTFAEAVRIVLEDDGVDAVVVGCVPLTPALTTLEESAAHAENLYAPSSIAHRLVQLAGSSSKPIAVAVDAGSVYEPLRALLREGGLPTFGGIGRAVRCLAALCGEHLERARASSAEVVPQREEIAVQVRQS